MDFSQLMTDLINPMNIVFFTAIIITFVICLIWKKDKNLVTMWGILGTFMGIVLALQGLDTKNIAESIPNLLSGLKTAFWTSIFGAFFAIILSFLQRKEDNQEEVDFLKEISKSQKSLEKNFEKFLETQKTDEILLELQNLNKNIGGDWDTSLLTQFQKMRMTFSEKQDELIKEFRDFSHQMAENNTKALIEAVQQVMEDFNAKINDQLGQSFQDLKWAIDNLLKWQDNYKNILENTEKSLANANDSLQKSSNAFEITQTRSEKFTEIAKSFGESLENLDSSLKILKNGLNEFDGIAKNNSEMTKNLVESMDILKDKFLKEAENIIKDTESHIKNMKENFAKQSEDLVESHKKILKNTTENIEEMQSENTRHFKNIREGMENSVFEIEKTFKKQTENLEATQGVILDDLKKSSGKMQENFIKFSDDLSGQFKDQTRDIVSTHKNILDDTNQNISNIQKKSADTFARMEESLKNQVLELDRQLGEQLSKSINSLGQQLTSLSGKFVSDYGQLAEKLESLIRNSRR